MRISFPFCAVARIALLAVFYSSDSSALQSAYIDGAQIVKVQHDISTTRGPNGRAFVWIDRHFNPVGSCVWGGGVDNADGWAFEFAVEHGSFKSLFAMAIAARMSNATVRIDYDDNFGSGYCRVINLSIH